ncbi:MAG: hypothetical protein AAFX10_06480 [Pseudomonadota bacterium]
MIESLRYWLPVPALLLLAAFDAEARSVPLEDWIDGTLLPGVHRALSEKPRFKGQTIRFVVFEDGAPAAASNALAIGMRDRLVDLAIARGGIRVASTMSGTTPGQRIDCAETDADYLVGIELTPAGSKRAEVVVRAQDLHENTWVSGINIRWRGELNRGEQRALDTPVADAELRGARSAPFDAHQTDLLALKLARGMACQLLGSTSADYVLALPNGADDDQDALWARTLDIASRHVASLTAIEFATSNVATNATLDGTAHEIGNGLYQYWLTVEPTEAGASLETISVSAYVRRGPTRVAASPPAVAPTLSTPVSVPHIPKVVIVPGAFGNGALGPLRIAEDQGGAVLKTAIRSDTIVFFLQFEPGSGLVRLGDRDCQARTIARVARAGDLLAFPIAGRSGADTVGEISRWQVDPLHNTYFAVASRNSGLARRLAAHVERLPMRCGSAAPAGLTDRALRRWLDEFIELVDDRPREVAWRAVQTREPI